MSIKVWPKDENVQKLLRHPVAGGFRDMGAVEWPDDSFTFRRVKDGDVLTKDPTPAPAPRVVAPKAEKKFTADKGE